jgi:Spy/CpxP family protein refolding chaperone
MFFITGACAAGTITLTHEEENMQTRKTVFISIIAVLALAIGASVTMAGNNDFVSDLDLTKEQIGKLAKIVDTFNAKELELEGKIEATRLALAQELRKADRWDSEAKNKASAKIVNRQVKRLLALGSDMLKLRVAYFLKAKDVFTEEQRMIILGRLTEFDMDLPDSFSYYLELDLPALDLDLTDAQIKKLLKYRADMEIRDIKHELALNYKLLDLRSELLSPERDPKKVNRLITAIADIGTKIVENKVSHILRAKDVLTVEQKMTLVHMMLLMGH